MIVWGLIRQIFLGYTSIITPKSKWLMWAEVYFWTHFVRTKWSSALWAFCVCSCPPGGRTTECLPTVQMLPLQLTPLLVLFCSYLPMVPPGKSMSCIVKSGHVRTGATASKLEVFACLSMNWSKFPFPHSCPIPSLPLPSLCAWI